MGSTELFFAAEAWEAHAAKLEAFARAFARLCLLVCALLTPLDTSYTPVFMQQIFFVHSFQILFACLEVRCDVIDLRCDRLAFISTGDVTRREGRQARSARIDPDKN